MTKYSPTTRQGFTNNMCWTEASSATKTLVDVRDGETYSVRYVKDKCWMTKNLKLGYNASNPNTTTINLKTVDSDVSSDKTLILYNQSSNSTNSSDVCYRNSYTGLGWSNPCVYSSSNANYGVWYNYAAASAGQITSAGSSPDVASATESICPAGWRLPTNAEIGGVGGGLDTYTSLLSPINGGSYGNSGPGYTGYGFYWGTTGYSNIYSSVLRYDSGNNKIFSTVGERTDSYYVRCVLRDNRVLSNIGNMQEVNPDIVANTANGATAILTDTRDSKTYTVAKINGNLWMTQNLRLGQDINNPTTTTLTLKPTDSNVYSDKNFIIYGYSNSVSSDGKCYGTSTGGGAGYTNPCMYSSDNNSYGVWYNYAAASAGQIAMAADSTDVTSIAGSSICPRGWTLPRDSQISTITGSIYMPIFNGVLGGSYYHGATHYDTYGFYWGADMSEGGNNNRRNIRINGSSNIVNVGGNRTDGYYIRCVQAS